MSHSIVMFMFRIYIHILVTILYIHESFVFIISFFGGSYVPQIRKFQPFLGAVVCGTYT